MKVDVVGGPQCGRVYDIDPRQSVVLFPKELPVGYWWNASPGYKQEHIEVIHAPVRKRIDGTYAIDCIHISRHP